MANPHTNGLDVNLAIAPDMWTPTGPDDDPTARLSLHHPHGLAVCGLPLHLEAYAVTNTTRGDQCFVTDSAHGWGASDDLFHFFAPDPHASASGTM